MSQSDGCPGLVFTLLSPASSNIILPSFFFFMKFIYNCGKDIIGATVNYLRKTYRLRVRVVESATDAYIMVDCLITPLAVSALSRILRKCEIIRALNCPLFYVYNCAFHKNISLCLSLYVNYRSEKGDMARTSWGTSQVSKGNNSKGRTNTN